MKKCAVCGKQIEKSPWEGWFKDEEELICSVSCKEKFLANRKKIVYLGDKLHPEWRHDSKILFPQ